MSAPVPELVFFRQILPGDLLKLQAQSNTSNSGGGARDLRIRPGNVFGGYVKRMFPNPGKIGGKPHADVYHGTVNWLDQGNQRRSTQLEYWPPTDARPNEMRIARIHTCGAWALDATTQGAIEQGENWYFMLMLDTDGCVWARVFSEKVLPQMNVGFRSYIQQRIRDTKQRHAVTGVYDFTMGVGIRP